jgi:hypothetical protein
MAVVIPQSALKQVQHRLSMDTEANRGHLIQYKDPSFDDLKTAAASFARGDEVETGWLLDAWTLEGVPGGGGMLTLQCIPDDVGGGSGTTSRALRAVWTCKSVRNDMSILAYCGGAASRINLELWMKETDATLADANRFHATDTTVDTLNSQESAIANKIRKGIDTVIRFYPVLTCKSTWSRIPRSFLTDLGYVDTPGAPDADETVAPSNLSTLISAYDWLKVQDDVDQTGDGRYQRIESWMGIDGIWDANLYGPSRWPMPLQSAGE